MRYYETMRKVLEIEWEDEQVEAGDARARLALERMGGHTPKFLDYEEAWLFVREYGLSLRMNVDRFKVVYRT